MRVEDPAAYRYLFDDDVFLLSTEKHLFNGTIQAVEPAGAASQQPEPQPEAETPAEPVAPKPVEYLGQNKKGFIVLTHYTDTQFIATDHQAALEATLKRKDHTIDDIAIVNLGKYPDLTITQLAQQFKPRRILVLGRAAAPGELANMAFNQAGAFNNLPVLITYAFGEMMSSNDIKKAFWEQVKNF
ncbi:hypothetical protein LJ707_18935 [Mucilaginibacter sp. UR6-1]|uniref:hypothetical protein n=1 Tax=Mucilaginibacter sp. UR6-1 TaxID=1435643 RepID=UPI001E2E081D|nr:hypothetical protein [Mucilaginibacter sp. UR6-1]MCC8411023.1 hypothetical protein [Mucilaginibacter sp. UR6-1]